jgi:hypothetical protein
MSESNEKSKAGIVALQAAAMQSSRWAAVSAPLRKKHCLQSMRLVLAPLIITCGAAPTHMFAEQSDTRKRYWFKH